MGQYELHLGVDGCGVIVAQVLTEGHADDAAQMGELIDAVEGDITSFVADSAYDTVAVYGAAGARGAEVIVPPTRTAVVSRRGPRSAARDRTIKRVAEIGRRRWKKESGYHRQAWAENVFFRYKTTFGDRLRARHRDGQAVEARVACEILNRMTDLGRPESYAVGAMVD